MSITEEKIMCRNLKQGLKAIIIGTSDYKYIRPKLPGVANDIKCLADFLIYGWNIKEEDIVYLSDVTCAEALEAIENVCENMKPEEHLLFYFAGHCTLGEGDGKCYLAFYDTDLNPKENAPDKNRTEEDYYIKNVISLNYLNKLFLKCQAGIKIRVFDCCHSGESFSSLEEYFNKDKEKDEATSRGFGFFSKREAEAAEAEAENTAAEMLTENAMSAPIYNELMQNQKGWVTFCSCNIEETSQEARMGKNRQRRGLFSYFFTKGLMEALNDKDEPFYIEDLKVYTYQNLLEYYYENPMYDEDGSLMYQHMQYQCSLSGNLTVN